MRKTGLLLACILITILSNAQNNDVTKSSFDSVMRGNGRIYVVIAVLLFILFGIFFYLIRIEKKVTKLEAEHRK